MNPVFIAILIVIIAFGISLILTFLGSTNATLNFILSFVISSFFVWIFHNRKNPKIKVDVPEEKPKKELTEKEKQRIKQEVDYLVIVKTVVIPVAIIMLLIAIIITIFYLLGTMNL